MRFVSASEIEAVLDFPALVDAIAEAFRANVAAPLRHHHSIGIANDGGNATLLLMPAWLRRPEESFIGTKIVTVFPKNSLRGHPSVNGTYLLANGANGEPLAVIDGRRLTLWRTAASSALAAKFLARENSEHLLMVGAGALAPYLIRAHAAVRPLRRITIWNRTLARAEALAGALASTGLPVRAADDLESAARTADIVSSATLATQPVIHGAWLRTGTHVDLVGGFKPDMREADDEAMRRSRIYVDTRMGALREAGDIVDPIGRGVIVEDDICADLVDLCRDGTKGRKTAEEITLFKSVGTAIEDLATAMLIWRRFERATA